MLTPFQSMVGMIKRYYRKPKTVEFYFNLVGFTTLSLFVGYIFLDKEFYNNVFVTSSNSKNVSNKNNSIDLNKHEERKEIK